MAEGIVPQPVNQFIRDYEFIISGTNRPKYLLRRWGMIVCLYLYDGTFTSQNNINDAILDGVSNLPIDNIPLGFRPIYVADICDSYSKKRIRINTDGLISSNDSFSNVNIRLSTCWITSANIWPS